MKPLLLFFIFLMTFIATAFSQLKEIVPQVGYEGYTEVKFSGDGKYLISYQTYLESVQIWDMKLQKQIKILDGHYPHISPDNRIMAFMKEDQLMIYHFTNGTISSTNVFLKGRKDYKNNTQIQVVFSPDSKYLALCRTDESINWEYAHELKLVQLTDYLEIFASKGYLPVFSDDGKSLYYASETFMIEKSLPGLDTRKWNMGGVAYSINLLPGKSMLSVFLKYNMDSFGLCAFDPVTFKIMESHGYRCSYCGAQWEPWQVDFINDSIFILQRKNQDPEYWNKNAKQVINKGSGTVFINRQSNTIVELDLWDYLLDDFGYCMEAILGYLYEYDVIRNHTMQSDSIYCTEAAYSLDIHPSQKLIAMGGKSHIILKDFDFNTIGLWYGYAEDLKDLEFSTNNNDLIMVNSLYTTAVSLDKFQTRDLGWAADWEFSASSKQVYACNEDMYIFNEEYQVKDTLYLESGNYRDAIIRVSPDNKFVAFSAGNMVYLYDMADKSVIKQFEASCFFGKGVEGGIKDMAFSPSGKYLMAINNRVPEGCYMNSGLVLYDLEADHENSILPGAGKDDYDFETAAIFSDDEKYLLYIDDGSKTVKWFDLAARKLIRKLEYDDYIFNLTKVPNSNTFVASGRGKVYVGDVNSGKLLSTHQLCPEDIKICKFDKSGDLLALGLVNNTVELYRWEGKSKICNILALNGMVIIYTDEHYYLSSKGMLNAIAFQSEGKGYNFEQFDLKLNRPDIILARIGLADSQTIQMYYKSYLKRLRKMRFVPEMMQEDLNVPNMEILNRNDIPLNTDIETVKIQIRANDGKYKLERYNIWVNDVPVYGLNGISLRELNTGTFEKTEEISLMEGKNTIKVWCLNEQGIGSLKESVVVNLNRKEEVQPNLYLISIGVSAYNDQDMRLKYPVKDGRDIVELFTKDTSFNRQQFNKIYVDTLFDGRVTKQNILQLKSKLLSSKVDDIVVVSVSGHGLLDDSLDFYYATCDIDFTSPSEKGLLFAELENLLDGIPARKRLLLVDACHSGEIDKDWEEEDGNTTIHFSDGSQGIVSPYGTKGAKITSGSKSLSLNSSFELMQSMFTDLSQSTGTFVIAAAAGTGYALEGDQWHNGVFTYAFINGLKNKSADYNENNEITVNELKTYILEEVERLTDGRQKPTVRTEKTGFNWRLW